jgi:hypothetical protein
MAFMTKHPYKISDEDEYRRARRSIEGLVPPADCDEVGRLLGRIDDYVSARCFESSAETVRELGLAMVAVGQARLWQRLWCEVLAGRDPVGTDDKRPGDEWAFLFGDEWPKFVPLTSTEPQP